MGSTLVKKEDPEIVAVACVDIVKNGMIILLVSIFAMSNRRIEL